MTDLIQQTSTDTDTTESVVLTVTPLAATKIRELLVARNLPNHALRVFVAGGGCSGLQYGMALEGDPQEFDTVVSVTDGVRVVIDPTSLMYVGGATIDFVDSIMGGGFRIDNPNAVSSCGCGSSFRTKDEGSAQSGSCGCGGGGCG